MGIEYAVGSVGKTGTTRMIELTKENREDLHKIISETLYTFQKLDEKWYVGGQDDLIDKLNESGYLAQKEGHGF